MAYSMEELLKSQEIHDFIESRAYEINKIYREIFNETFKRHGELFYGTIDYIMEISEERVSFQAYSSCCGCMDYETFSIPTEYFVTEEYENAIRKDIELAYQEEQEKEKELQRQKELKEAEAKKKAEELDYLQYLNLKARFEKNQEEEGPQHEQ